MELGQGNYAKVYKVEDVSGKSIAKKEFYSQSEYLKELDILAKLQHENIVAKLGSAVIDNKNVLFLEFCDCNMNVYAQNRIILNKDAINFGRQIARGLAHMHSRHIIHRDIKPENILYSFRSGTIKICDFNLAVELAAPTFEISGFTGSPLYSAPEVMRGKKYTYFADIWSFGVTMFRIRTGKDVFKSQMLADLEDEIRRKDYKMPPHIGNFGNYILAAMQYSPKKRRELTYFIEYAEE